MGLVVHDANMDIQEEQQNEEDIETGQAKDASQHESDTGEESTEFELDV